MVIAAHAGQVMTHGLAIILGTVLRLLDARAGSQAEVRPARAGLLRVCAYVPAVSGETDITGLRVLLVADVLGRAAETHELQALTAFVFAGEASAQAAAFERAAEALGVHPPVAYGGVREAQASLGGPLDVHLVSDGADADAGRGGVVARVGAAHLRRADGQGGARAGEVLAGQGNDPLAVRLALISVPYHQPADLTEDMLASAQETVVRWRRQVAGWAESPSRPVPARIAQMLWSAFGDLDTVSALAALRDLALDAGIPAGAKFETFLSADRVLGLDLPRDIGRTGGGLSALGALG